MLSMSTSYDLIVYLISVVYEYFIECSFQMAIQNILIQCWTSGYLPPTSLRCIFFSTCLSLLGNCLPIPVSTLPFLWINFILVVISLSDVVVRMPSYQLMFNPSLVIQCSVHPFFGSVGKGLREKEVLQRKIRKLLWKEVIHGHLQKFLKKIIFLNSA